MLSFLLQVGSHNIFVKYYPSCGRQGAMIFLIFLQKLTTRKNIYSRPCKSNHKKTAKQIHSTVSVPISFIYFPVLNQIFCKLLLYSTVFSNLWRKFHKFYIYFLKGQILLVKYAKTKFCV